MNSSEIVTLFRSEMGDTASPYLWSDADAFNYLDDAQSMFCRKTDGISDARTAAVCDLAIVPGTEWYDTHQSILNIRSITRADTGQPVKMQTVEQMAQSGAVWLASLQSVLKNIVLGFEPHAVRAYPMPNETVTLNMRVWRLPLVAITDIGDQAMEIDAQHHQHLTLWMKHRAYSKQDAETADRDKAFEFEQRFLAYCASVQREQERARRVHGTIAYGGL